MHPEHLQPPPEFWHRPDVVDALEQRDIGAVLRRYRGVTGASQTSVGLLVGLAQSHVSALERGRRRITSLDLFERFADGLGIPRTLLGLDATVGADGDDSASAAPSSAAPSPAASADEAGTGDVGRRAVLRTIGMAASTSGVSPDELLALLDLDMAPGAERPRSVDPRALDALGAVLHRAAGLGPPVKPAHIQSTVHAVLARLIEAEQHPTTPALRRWTSQLLSDAACFVGWLQYDQGRIAGARAYFSLAADAAGEARDVTRTALVLASRATSFSPASDGGPGDAARALGMLDAAEGLLATQPAHRAHAWVHANAAARAALAGDRWSFDAHRERARWTQQREPEPTYGLWHSFPPRSVDADWLDDYLCGGLVQLGDPGAQAALDSIITRTSHQHRIADASTLLMQVHLAHDDHDAAAAAGLAALTAARTAGLGRQDFRIRGMRALAPADEPVYAELDAALRAA